MKRTYLIHACAGLLAVATVSVRADETNDKGAASEPRLTLTSGFDFVTVSGDEAQYRADHWLRDGWSGGIEDLSWQHALSKDWTLDLDARAIFGNEDYKVGLELVNPDVGFVRVGFKQFRKYFQSTGGYYRFDSGRRYFDLNFDPILDSGNISVDIGLTLPNVPKVTVGYEHQYKDGAKSLLEWGSVYGSYTTNGISYPVQRKIAPGYKNIDETTDIFKFSIEHDIKNIHVGNEFRFERHDSEVFRFLCISNNTANATQAVPQKQRVWETYTHDGFYNAFHAESQMMEKLYWSLGYMYNSLNGDATYNMDQPGVTSRPRLYYSNLIDLGEFAHVVNGNLFYTPHKTLSLYGGLEYEGSRTRGHFDGNLLRGTTTNLVDYLDDTHLSSLTANLGVRYTGIPFTTLYVDGRWQEQQIDKDENDLLAVSVEDIDADVHRYWITAGVACAPIRQATLTAQYRYSSRDNSYSPGADQLISAQEFTTDELSTKLMLRLHPKLNLSFRYRMVSTEIESTFEETTQNESGGYDLNIYSVAATVTPVSRLYLTGLISYQDTRTETYRNPATATDNPSLIVLPYRGDVWSVTGATGVALDEKSDLTASYTFSKSANFTDNSSVGIPYGTDWERQEVLVSLSRRLQKNVSMHLRYAYSEYQDDSSAGINDYRAHLFGAACTVRF